MAFFLDAVGIPSYGPPGLSERAIVKAVYAGRDFLTELVKAYAAQ